MRTIKFRGFNAKNNQWLYGSHIINRGEHFVAPDEFADDKTWEDYEVEPDTIGQFTGLHDKNGKEIFEGDILSRKILGSDKRMTFVVIFKAHMGAFVAKFRDEIQPCSKVLCRYYEVVGNIHDNPELLKGGES